MKQIAIIGFALLCTGCSSNQKTYQLNPMRVNTLVIEPSCDVDARTYVGTIEEKASAALSFAVPGTISRMYVDEGERVTKGRLLAELDPTSVRQSYEAAKATLEQAEDACRRLKILYDGKSLPEIKWVEAQTRLSQARSAYQIARKNLDDTRLVAPFSGVIGKRRLSAGENAVPGVPVVTLLDIDKVKVRFSVPEREIAALSTDSRVEVRVAALNDRRFEASKIEKGAVANSATHTYDVRATMQNGESELLPGMVCNVVVSPADAVEEIAVPLRALQKSGSGRSFVWKVQGDTVVRCEVETDRLVNNGVAIAGGLEEGDRIVIDGMQKIGQGSKVIW